MSGHQPLRVLFYVQHLLGIGHLMRVRRIVSALRDDNIDVMLVTGGMPLAGFDLTGIEHVALPPMAVSNDEFSTLVDDTGKPIDDAFKQQRCQMLLDTYRSWLPDIVVLEAFPFGRRQVRFELLPLIEAIEASETKPLLLSSIRDILQRRTKPGRDAETARLINAHFDKVLVHGDPTFATLDSSFACASEINDKIVYTGMVSAAPPNSITEQFDVVVSAGGGAVGADLVRAAIGASTQLPSLGSWCVITGPNLPEQEFIEIARSAPSNVTVERFRNDFTALLAQAQLSISQAGYNTVSDVLQAKCRAVLVPFSAGGETEQLDRAMRLQELGVASFVADDRLSEQHLVAAITTAMSQAPGTGAAVIDAEGAGNTVRILKQLVSQRR